MAITLEQVDRLRERADVSFEEAKAALEQNGGDLLDALIWLERQGKTRPTPGGFYSTRGPAPEGGEGPVPPAPSGAGSRGGQERQRSGWESFRDGLRDLIQRGLDNTVQVERGGKTLLSIPVLMGALLLVAGFWIVVPLLIVGLFLGCRYHFAGPDLGRESVNQVMDRVSNTAEDIKNSVKTNWNREDSDCDSGE